jgi:peptidoglycan/LPS O-acetylase OafA/YrhL
MTRRRLLAVAALVLGSLAVLFALGYAADDPQQAFGLLLTLSLSVLAAGYGLVRRGVVRVVALVVAGLLVLGAVEQLVDSRLVERLVLAGMLWLAIWAAGAAFLVHVPCGKPRGHADRCSS